MITQELLAARTVDYLNGHMALEELVHWAEDAMVTFTESNERPPNADIIWDALLYLGAADSPDFPLTATHPDCGFHETAALRLVSPIGVWVAS